MSSMGALTAIFTPDGPNIRTASLQTAMSVIEARTPCVILGAHTCNSCQSSAQQRTDEGTSPPATVHVQGRVLSPTSRRVRIWPDK